MTDITKTPFKIFMFFILYLSREKRNDCIRFTNANTLDNSASVKNKKKLDKNRMNVNKEMIVVPSQIE